jgi:hypothetical protein
MRPFWRDTNQLAAAARNIAFRVGRTLNCDSTNGHILNDKEAYDALEP